MSKSGISYRVYQHRRVKHKVPFFGEEVYPVYITIIYGRRALNFKSHLFENLLREKYQVSFRINNCCPTIEDVIAYEETLVASIIERHRADFSLDDCKHDYVRSSIDLTHVMDEQSKEFLVDFFYREAFPSIALSIKNTADALTADIILKDLKTSLTPALQEKLFSHPLLCIPLFRFCNRKLPGQIPLLTFYIFGAKQFVSELAQFLGDEDAAAACIGYVMSFS